MPARSNERMARGRCQRWVTTTTLSMPALRSRAAVNTRIFPGRARLSSVQATGTPNSVSSAAFISAPSLLCCVGGASAADRDRQLQLAIGIGGKDQPFIGCGPSRSGYRRRSPSATSPPSTTIACAPRKSTCGGTPASARRSSHDETAGVATANSAEARRQHDYETDNAPPQRDQRADNAQRDQNGRRRKKAERDEAFHSVDVALARSDTVDGRRIGAAQPPRTYLRQTRRR